MPQIKDNLKKSIEKFSMDFPEWGDYTLTEDNGKVIVESVDGTVSSEAAKELIRDFEVILKKNNLMVTDVEKDSFTVAIYTYEVEEGMEELADELEFKLGKYFSNLRVVEKDGKPFVSFSFIGNLVSSEKENIKKEIKKIMSEYTFVDEDDVFANVKFDDLDEILDEINQEDLDEELEEYIKANDDFVVNETITVDNKNKDFILKVERDLQKAIQSNDKSKAKELYHILFKIDYSSFQRESGELDDLIERLPEYEKQIENIKPI